MKLSLRHCASIIPALIITLCTMGGHFVGQENHDKMKLTHGEEIKLVRSYKKEISERQKIS